jgi:hypothetical protein
VPHEQRRFLRALARSLPWALAAILVTAGLCLLVGAPRWAASILVPVVGVLVPLAYARDELRAQRGAAGAWALAAAHLVLPLVGIPLAIEGLRSGNRALAMTGTGLLVLVVVSSAIVLPWLTARRQKRERAGRAR